MKLLVFSIWFKVVLLRAYCWLTYDNMNGKSLNCCRIFCQSSIFLFIYLFSFSCWHEKRNKQWSDESKSQIKIFMCCCFILFRRESTYPIPRWKMMGRKEEIEDDQGDRDTGVGPMAWVFKPTSAFACGFGSFSYPIFLNLCFSCDSIDYLICGRPWDYIFSCSWTDEATSWP